MVEQGGVVRTFQNDPDATASTEFFDISSRVHMEGEAGLLGMAFHPSFTTNGLVYPNFTEQVGGELRSVTAEVHRAWMVARRSMPRASEACSRS